MVDGQHVPQQTSAGGGSGGALLPAFFVVAFDRQHPGRLRIGIGSVPWDDAKEWWSQSFIAMVEVVYEGTTADTVAVSAALEDLAVLLVDRGLRPSIAKVLVVLAESCIPDGEAGADRLVETCVLAAAAGRPSPAAQEVADKWVAARLDEALPGAGPLASLLQEDLPARNSVTAALARARWERGLRTTSRPSIDPPAGGPADVGSPDRGSADDELARPLTPQELAHSELEDKLDKERSDYCRSLDHEGPDDGSTIGII